MTEYKTLDQITLEYTAYIIYRSNSLAEAARRLGIHRRTLDIYVEKYKLKPIVALARRFPAIVKDDYCCTPNLTPEERDYITNRSINVQIPRNINRCQDNSIKF